jgi:hypothetical protein
MPELPKPIRELLEQLGISQESAQRFRFGGIVGKVALVALGGFAAVIGAAKYTAGTIQITSVVAVLLTTLLIIHWIFRYAEKHPSSATLEGAEVILWQQQQIMLAAKNMPAPQDTQIVPNPGGSPPQSNPPQGVEE